MKKQKKFSIESSSGNVFADLGLPNPEERLVKAQLAAQIYSLIKKKKLTPKKTSSLLGIDQSITFGTADFFHFSLDQLFKFLNILGQDITIHVTRKIKSTQKPSITVHVPEMETGTEIIANVPVVKTRRTPSVRKSSTPRALYARKK